MIPQAQLGAGDEGQPMTVRYVALMQPVQAQWYDEGGRGHAEVWFIGAGGVVYQPPNSEAWAAELRPIKEGLAEQVRRLVGMDQPGKQADLPKDAVDVMGGG
mgnify:CR=1 FL=1